MKLTQERFVDILKTGNLYDEENIRAEIERLIALRNSAWTNHDIQRDHIEKMYYLYDNECYLFIFDDKIQVRCDRDNVNSSGMTLNFPIKNKHDISKAYDEFRMMTMEDEE
jgi:hypothetical protein